MERLRITDNKNYFVRYKNRKIYCVAYSRYVSLGYIFDLIENGEKVTIAEKNLGYHDITAITLAREAVTHYYRKHNVQPTFEQLVELINLIKSWPRTEKKHTQPRREAKKTLDEGFFEKEKTDESDETTQLPIGLANKPL